MAPKHPPLAHPSFASGLKKISAYAWGFNKLAVNELEAEILRLGKEGSAIKVREHRFGKNVEIRGSLKGPNGKELPVKTVWLVPKLRSPARFVTLIPDL